MEIFLPGSEQEKQFLKVLADLESYNEQIVLVGGWLPYMYARYLWKLESDVFIVKTTDIDFALQEQHFSASPPIVEKLLRSREYVKEPVYSEEETPFDLCVLYGNDEQSRMRIDFLSHEYCNPADVQQYLLGEGVNIIPLETVDFMLKKSNWIKLIIPCTDRKIECHVLKPSAYMLIKGISFANRSYGESDYKYVKDMWSLYFVLNTIPLAAKAGLFAELRRYQAEEDEYYPLFLGNLKEYLSAEEQQGVIDLAGFLKGDFPERVMKKRIVSKFRELIAFLEE